MTPARRVLHEKRHLIWPVVVAMLVNVALYAIVIYPLSQKVAGGEETAQASTAALTAARRDHAAARATVKNKGEATRELEKFYGEVLPPDLGGARRITYTWIDQLAKRSNLKLERENTDAKAQRDSNLWKLVYSATLSGEYHSIRKFIHELETAAEFLVLENVELSQMEGAGRSGLNVNVQIATYFRAGANGD